MNRLELFLASTEQWRSQIELLKRYLSSDELARSDALLFPEKRAQSALSRGLLRHVLGLYLNRDPADLKFVYSETGKPALDPAQNPTHIQFNVSHSGDRWLLALTRGQAVGVDIEQVRAIDDLPALARTVMPPLTMRRFLRLDRARQEQAFFTQWTRAEAIAKATGEGIFTASRSTEIIAPGRFVVVSFRPCVGYFAAIALESNVRLNGTFHHLKPKL